jgi:hypothetical protein
VASVRDFSAGLAALVSRLTSESYPGDYRIERGGPFLLLCLRTLLLLALFMGLERFLFEFLRLSEQEYASPVLVIAVLEKIGVFGVLFAVATAGLLAVYGRLLAPWSALETGTGARVLVVFLAALVAWPLSTYGYNYYYDQGYFLDRFLLLAAVFLTWYRPAFIYLFLVLAFVSLWQVDVPHLNNASHIPHKTQVLHVLCLFAAAFGLYALGGSRRLDGFFFLSCCLVAAAYWQPAFSKLQLNWLGHGQLYLMPLAAHAHGWMAGVPAESMVAFAEWVARFDRPMLLFVLLIETACLMFLFRRSLSMLLLVCLIVFHLGVFLLYGYFFWTWIALNAALLVLLYRDRRRRNIRIYSTGHFLLGAILVGFSAHWCFPSSLGWYDTRLSYTFRYEAIGVSGKAYEIPPRFFAPYGDVFTMAPFYYLVREHGGLVTPYATTGDPHVANGLARSTTPAGVFALESSLGLKTYNDRLRERYVNFVSRYLAHRNEGNKEPALLRLARSPPQFWSFPRGDVVYSGQEPIQALRVREVTTLYDGRALREIRELPLLDIPVEVGER